MNEKEIAIKLLWLGLMAWGEDFIEDMKKELWIDNDDTEPEKEEEIDARFLRGQQKEIDELRKLLHKKEKELRETEKMLWEAQRTLESRDETFSKMYDFLRYPLSDTKKIDVIKKVVDAVTWADRTDKDVEKFYKWEFKYWERWIWATPEFYNKWTNTCQN